MSLFQPSKPTIIYNAEGKQISLSPAEATQFDKSSIARSKEFSSRYESCRSMALLGFESGRYSARASMRILSEAIRRIEEEVGSQKVSTRGYRPTYFNSEEAAFAMRILDICKTSTNRVCANGDYPLKD